VSATQRRLHEFKTDTGRYAHAAALREKRRQRQENARLRRISREGPVQARARTMALLGLTPPPQEPSP
jgi:hypothetical protein